MSPVEDLIARCQAGEPRAFSDVYQLHYARVRRVCASLLVGVPEEVDDAVQLVFVEAFRHIHRFDGTSAFSTWLYGIALRVASNTRRGRRRRARLADAYVADGPATGQGADHVEAQLDARARLRRVHDALAKVSERHRTSFLLYYGAGLKLAEIGAVMDAPVQTVSARIQAARQAILKMTPASRDPDHGGRS